jgi:hypothetical protein
MIGNSYLVKVEVSVIIFIIDWNIIDSVGMKVLWLMYIMIVIENE